MNLTKTHVKSLFLIQEHFEEGDDSKKPAPKAKAKAKGKAGASSAVQNVNKSSEKSTLGDLDALSALKEKMEKGK